MNLIVFMTVCFAGRFQVSGSRFKVQIVPSRKRYVGELNSMLVCHSFREPVFLVFTIWLVWNCHFNQTIFNCRFNYVTQKVFFI